MKEIINGLISFYLLISPVLIFAQETRQPLSTEQAMENFLEMKGLVKAEKPSET
jgi:hypothetical protein